MAARNAPNGPFVIQANQHSAEVLRQFVQSVFTTAGVINAGDLAVTALSPTPGMAVNVAAGFGVIPGTQVVGTQGSYHVYNDATVQLGVAAANATNPRIDLVVATVQDAAYSGTSNQWLVQVITGAPAASPVAPAVPANSITLAQLGVAANATSITSANITDTRLRASASRETTWQPTTLANGWLDAGGSQPAIGFRLIGSRVVLRGAVKSGTIGQPAFTLPAGYRPGGYERFAVASGTGQYGQVEISASGQVTPTVGSALQVDLNGITFDTV